MQLVLDQDVTVVGDIHRVGIELMDTTEPKRMRIEIVAHGEDNKISKSVLMADELTAESEKKMPVVIGDETIAHTPIEIRGMTKHIKMIVPRSAKLTETKAS